MASKPRALLDVAEGDALAIFEASYEKYFTIKYHFETSGRYALRFIQ